MNWKLKALIQRTIARLPRRLGDELYYRMQRMYGAWYTPADTMAALRDAAKMGRIAAAHGRPFLNADVFEVGTGRRIDMPFGFFLMGARSVTTCDLYRLLKPELIAESQQTMVQHYKEIIDLFEPFTNSVRVGRSFDAIVTLKPGYHPVTYVVGDAADTRFQPESFDLHVSNTVLEHIEWNALKAIMYEARRILRPGGLAIHHVDASDHFSHGDKSISSANFLQYSDAQWNRIAGNRFAYHNRLRLPDFTNIFQQAFAAPPTVANVKIDTDRVDLHRVNHRFLAYLPSELAAAQFDLIARKAGAP